MRVAFVNQPIDTILPPGQNSVGACTYGVARALCKSLDIIVYGLKDSQEKRTNEVIDQNVRFRFFASTRSDSLLYNLRRRYGKLVQTSAPLSTSNCLFPNFGREVALDLQRQHCDVIHLQHCSQYLPVIRAYNPKAKIVLHLHAQCFSQNKCTLDRRLRYVDLLTTVSQHVTVRTRRDFPAMAERCETMYNGIDASEFMGPKDYRPKANEGKRILYVGAISPHRGIHVLIDAFKIVLERVPDARLDLVGPHVSYPLEETFDLEDRASITSIAPFYSKQRVSLVKAKLSLAPHDAGTYYAHLKENLPVNIGDKIRFFGMVKLRSELIDHYYNADVFAFPSVCDDSFGIPPVEAMAAGVPVVATRSGGVIETVKDGTTGLLVDKNDPGSLAQALIKVLENNGLRESMGKAARQRALQHFTWDRVAKAMCKRYRSLCNS